MFSLVTDEFSLGLRIGIHLSRTYEMATTFMTANAAHDLTRKDFKLAVSPNYELLSELKIGEERKLDDNGKRITNFGKSGSVSLGYYESLDVVHDTVMTLEEWYKAVLCKHGAEHRILSQEGNHYSFKPDEKARPTRLDVAILQARALQAFDMMRQDHPVDHATIVGRIMPVFMQSIGLPGYAVSHDLTKEGFGKVTFHLEELASFSFYKPLKKDDPCFMQRHSYRGHDNYYLTYEGEVTALTLKSAVMGWLLGAVRERHEFGSIDDYLDDSADIIGDLITKPRQHQTGFQIVDPTAKFLTIDNSLPDFLPDNVVAFKPR